MPAKKSAKKAASANSKKAVKPNSALKQKSGKKKINGQNGKDVKVRPALSFCLIVIDLIQLVLLGNF